MANDATDQHLIDLFGLPGDLDTLSAQHLTEMYAWIEDHHNPGVDDQDPPVQIPIDANVVIRYWFSLMNQQVGSHKRSKTDEKWGR